MFKGISFVLSACLIWGLIFVIPSLLKGFSPIEITLCRYFFFGLLSLMIISFNFKKFFRDTPLHLWVKAFVIGFFGNLAYYFFMVLGLFYSTPSVGTLILGICPITIALYGNLKNQECSYKSLILPSIAIAVGLLLVNLPEFDLGVDETLSLEYLFGLMCSFTSLVLWTWYAVTNSRILQSNPKLNSATWSTMIGATAFAWVFICFSILFFFYNDLEYYEKYSTWNPELTSFIAGGMTLGFLCTWLGSYLWNRASSILPVSLAGQLTIFETIFGLLFVYLAGGRFPTVVGLVGCL